MSSRMTKYYSETKEMNSRYQRNEDLYKEIGKSDLDNFDVKSNAVILGDNKKEIDVEKIKKILDTKYNEVPKRRSIRLEPVEDIEIDNVEDTKEYDINVILEKAREQKSDNYEEERFKKLRDTQFDILKNLNLDKKEEKYEEETEEEKDLKNLINTITYNENHNNDSTPLDILSDLKGSGNTEVLDGLKEEIEKEEKKENTIFDTKMINSFYTSSNALKDKDFEDIDDDFSKSIEGDNNFIKFIVGFILILFIIGIVVIIKFMN